MSFPFLTSPAPLDAADTSWAEQPIIYLALAAACMVIVLRLLKRAMSPIGALLQAAAAAAVVAFTALLALAALIIAAWMTVR